MLACSELLPDASDIKFAGITSLMESILEVFLFVCFEGLRFPSRIFLQFKKDGTMLLGMTVQIICQKQITRKGRAHDSGAARMAGS